MTLIYVGLDIATVTGYAIWNPETQVAKVWQMKGDPIAQIKSLSHVLQKEKLGSAIICIEELHHIQNHKTVVSLAERRGFIYYTLVGVGYTVQNVHSESARSLLKTRNKEETFRKFIPFYKGSAALTSDMTDALAVALYGSLNVDWEKLCVINYTGE